MVLGGPGGVWDMAPRGGHVGITLILISSLKVSLVPYCWGVHAVNAANLGIPLPVSLWALFSEPT